MLIVFFRVLLIYALIVASLRLMGKRQLGQLQPSELVVTILVSNIATLSIEDTNVPLLGGIIPILCLVSFDVVLSAANLRWKGIRRIVCGSPRVVIQNGQIDQKQLKELRFTVDDLMEQLRGKDIFDIQEVSYAVVETTGQLSVYEKFHARPLTPSTAGIPDNPADDMPPMVLISDGIRIDSALRYCNLKPEWLEKVLQQEGVNQKDVFLMTCDRRANYLLVPVDGKSPKPQKEAG